MAAGGNLPRGVSFPRLGNGVPVPQNPPGISGKPRSRTNFHAGRINRGVTATPDKGVAILCTSVWTKEKTMAKLKVGDKAPLFSLEDQNGRLVSLDQFRGTRLLLYFYPRADTPGCTRQACSVRDRAEHLQEVGAAAAGISPDPPEKQKKFDQKYRLGFPLLSDPDHKVAQAYGAWGRKSMYGRTHQGVIRSSFLIDEDGYIQQVTYHVKPEDTVPLAEKVLV
jgi:peroxiredoxin Q/BCP